MSEINFDTAALLDFKNIRAGQKFDFVLPFFQDDETTPLVISGTFKMAISKTKDDANVELTLEAGAGLTIGASSITIDVGLISALPPGNYHYDMRNDRPDTTNYPVFYGTIKIIPNITDL